MTDHGKLNGLKNKNGWWMQHHEIYPLLGLRVGQHLPPDGFDRVVNGLRFICEPASETPRRPHRLFVQCTCDRLIPFGRIGQHIKGRQHKEWLAIKGEPEPKPEPESVETSDWDMTRESTP